MNKYSRVREPWQSKSWTAGSVFVFAEDVWSTRTPWGRDDPYLVGYHPGLVRFDAEGIVDRRESLYAPFNAYQLAAANDAFIANKEWRARQVGAGWAGGLMHGLGTWAGATPLQFYNQNAWLVDLTVDQTQHDPVVDGQPETWKAFSRSLDAIRDRSPLMEYLMFDHAEPTELVRDRSGGKSWFTRAGFSEWDEKRRMRWAMNSMHHAIRLAKDAGFKVIVNGMPAQFVTWPVPSADTSLRMRSAVDWWVSQGIDGFHFEFPPYGQMEALITGFASAHVKVFWQHAKDQEARVEELLNGLPTAYAGYVYTYGVDLVGSGA